MTGAARHALAAPGAPRASGRALRATCAVLAATVMVLLAGCERSFRDMYDQPRYKPLAASPLWRDGRASRPPVDGSVARSEGTFAGTSSGRLGIVTPAPVPGPFDTIRDVLRPEAATGTGADITLPRFTVARLERGRKRFDIFCSPCHSSAGDGDGMVARRGFPHPPSFHSERLRAVSNAHIYAVITQGYGAMHSYATRVPPDDRLAIIAYIRALQFSQHAPVAALDGADVARLDAADSGGASGTSR